MTSEPSLLREASAGADSLSLNSALFAATGTPAIVHHAALAPVPQRSERAYRKPSSGTLAAELAKERGVDAAVDAIRASIAGM